MVSQRFSTIGSNWTLPSLKAVRNKVFLSCHSSCREIIRSQLIPCVDSVQKAVRLFFFFLSPMCILNAEGRTCETVPKAKCVCCQLQNTGIQKSNIGVVVSSWISVLGGENGVGVRCWLRCRWDMLALRLRCTEFGTTSVFWFQSAWPTSAGYVGTCYLILSSSETTLRVFLGFVLLW